MSLWEEHQLEEKIIDILRTVPETTEHHFGQPFLTAYQIAIAFAERYADVFAQLGTPLGGAGVGQRSSLAQYLAREISQRIKSSSLPQVEGAFISNQHLHDIAFDYNDQVIHSSLTDTQYTLSMFRLRKVATVSSGATSP